MADTAFDAEGQVGTGFGSDAQGLGLLHTYGASAGAVDHRLGREQLAQERFGTADGAVPPARATHDDLFEDGRIHADVGHRSFRRGWPDDDVRRLENVGYE